MSSMGSSSNLSGRLSDRDMARSVAGDKVSSSAEAGFSNTSSGRDGVLPSVESGCVVVASGCEAKDPVCIVLALFLPRVGDILPGSNRVKDFAV